MNNQDDDLSFERIINVPSRKLGRRFLDGIRALADERGISLYSALQLDGDAKAAGFVDLIEDAKQFALENRVSDLLNRLLDRSGYKKMVREDQDEDRLENLDELLSSIRFSTRASVRRKKARWPTTCRTSPSIPTTTTAKTLLASSS